MSKKEKNVSGEEIKIMRIKAGLKQAELADISGYSVRSISDWECGKPPKRKSTIENIVRILNNYARPSDATESIITDNPIPRHTPSNAGADEMSESRSDYADKSIYNNPDCNSIREDTMSRNQVKLLTQLLLEKDKEIDQLRAKLESFSKKEKTGSDD